MREFFYQHYLFRCACRIPHAIKSVFVLVFDDADGLLITRGPEWFGRQVNMAANQLVRDHEEKMTRLGLQELR